MSLSALRAPRPPSALRHHAQEDTPRHWGTMGTKGTKGTEELSIDRSIDTWLAS